MTDQRLVEAFERLASQLPDLPERPVEQLRGRASRRMTWHRTATAAFAVVLVGLAVAGVAALVESRAGLPVVEQGPPGASGAPLHDSPVTLLLSPQVFSSQGGTLALIVVNRSDEEFSYGVGGTVHKWEDGEWRHFAEFGSALTFWHGAGEFVTGDELVIQPAILLSARARHAGPTEWITLPTLDNGWYQFSKGDVDGSRVASAILEVSDSASGPQLTTPGAGPVLDIRPSALAPMEARELRFVVSAPQQNQGQDITELRESMADTGKIEVWRDSAWQTVTEVDIDKNPSEPRGNVYEWAINLPDLDAGAYRLVQHSTTAGPIVGHFWITELLATSNHT